MNGEILSFILASFENPITSPFTRIQKRHSILTECLLLYRFFYLFQIGGISNIIFDAFPLLCPLEQFLRLFQSSWKIRFRPLFSGFFLLLDCIPICDRFPCSDSIGLPNTCGWRRIIFSLAPSMTSRIVNSPSSSAIWA